MRNEDNDILELEDLCDILKIGRSVSYRLLRSGDIPGFKIGRVWKIPREGLDKYIREQSGIKAAI